MRAVLEEVGASDVPTLAVFNKCDLLEDADRSRLTLCEPGALPGGTGAPGCQLMTTSNPNKG